MSTSLLYHAFNIKNVEYRSTRYIGKKIIFKAEMTDKNQILFLLQEHPGNFQGKENKISAFAANWA